MVLGSPAPCSKAGVARCLAGGERAHPPVTQECVGLHR